MIELVEQPPTIELEEVLYAEKAVSVSVLRLDMIHPFISGSKWFKLKYNLEEFFRQKKKYLVTFGGAYSNHIIATAAAGKEYGIQTVGIIRGEELHENSNAALQFASACGMLLFFVSRDDYRQIRKSQTVPGRFFSELRTNNYELYILPEGGSNTLAVKGCAEIANSISTDFDFILCVCGTGATLAGISIALKANQQAIGISVLEGEKFLEADILKLNGGRKNFRLIHDYSFGGYAKTTEALDLFCQNFSLHHGFIIEPVYTGKLFFALEDLIRKYFFKPGSKIVAVHTGGVFNFK